MKKILRLLTLALAGAMFMVACDETPAPYDPNPGGGDEPGTETTEITCAKAVELCAALADGASSTETYAITGYITDVYAMVSNGQQSFWMSDNNDGQKVVQAYWANLPEGVEKFTAGSKVKITGKLLKYVKDGNVTTEIKNATVEILEQGGDQPGIEATEITCAKAVELCAALDDGASSAETYAITGYITDVYATVSKGQQSFWMSDNNDGQKVVQAYWANLPEGVEAFTKGSKVKITGKLLKYVKDGNVTTEIKNATVEILEQGGGDTPDQPQGEAKGSGTESDPFNVAGAIAYINKLDADVTSDVEVYVKGKVSANSTTESTISSFGNMTFDMIDEGNASVIFKAFQVYGPGKQKFTSASQIAVGDEVVVCGKVVNYKGNTPETVGKGQSYVVSINGKTELPGGGETPDTPEETTEFSIDLPCTMGANAYNDGKATINGVKDVLTVKIGTAKKPGSFTVTMPAGKHTFYAVTWKGAGTADVTFSNGETLVKTVTVKENEGATGNAPFTLTVTDADKYEIEVAEETTFTVTSDKRVIFFGIK